jgi:hypothetical protein
MDSRAEPRPGAATAGRGGVMNFFLYAGIALAGVGGFLILGGGGGAVAGMTLALMGVIWALVGFGLRAFYQRVLRRAQAERELFASGRKAVAVVEGVQTTGMVLNNVNQQILLRLRVQPQGEPEFAHERRMFVPFHTLPRRGDVIDVAYDPADRSKVALATDWDSNTGGGQALLFRRPGDGEGSAGEDGVVEQLERLDRLRQSGSLTFSEFEALKAKIISGQGG